MQHLLTRALYLSALIGALAAFVPSGPVQAQVPVHPTSTIMFFDGVASRGGLVTDGTALYGATSGGGYAPGGVLYRLELNSPSPGAITSIYQWGRLDVWNGAVPASGVLLGSDGELYGTTILSSIDTLHNIYSPPGTIYRVSRSGLNYTRLFAFDPLVADSRQYAVNATGAMQLVNTGLDVQGALIEGLEGGVRYLYGGALIGGPDGTGTVYKIRADGTGFQVLAPFGAVYLDPSSFNIDTNPLGFDLNLDKRNKNLNGVNPRDRLTLGGDGYVYGVTRDGGANGTGVIFRVPVAGGTLEVLNEFDAIVPATTDPTTGAVITPAHNAEGGYPQGGMVLSGGMLYGTTAEYGPNGKGTVFRIAVDGSGYTVLRAFNTTDGATPAGDLILTSDGMLAGTTRGGGTLPIEQATGLPLAGTAVGTVYKLSLDGLTYSEECVFNSTDSALYGATPNAGVVQVADGSFYGTTDFGLYQNSGILYKCGERHPFGALGIRPFVDEGGGSLPMWLLALLTGVLGLRIIRDASARLIGKTRSPSNS